MLWGASWGGSEGTLVVTLEVFNDHFEGTLGATLGVHWVTLDYTEIFLRVPIGSFAKLLSPT